MSVGMNTGKSRELGKAMPLSVTEKRQNGILISNRKQQENQRSSR